MNYFQAASGIGKETAFSFAEAGAAGVIFADIDEESARAVCEKAKTLATHPEYRGIAVRVDVTDSTSVQSMVHAAVTEFGRIDYSVNSAGVMLRVPQKLAGLWLMLFTRLARVLIRLSRIRPSRNSIRL